MQPTILIAEDDPASRAALEGFLRRWGYAVQVACDGGEAWAALQQEDAPHLAILDWMMPVLDGLDVVRRLRGSARDHYTYVIMLTGRDQSSDMAIGFEGGVDDYLLKPFDRHELQSRLRVARRILAAQADLLVARDLLHEQALNDPLTGLRNRRAAEDVARRELAQSARSGQPVALALIDLDHFKRINDEHGHPVGDRVLCAAAHHLQAALRAGDFVARWGGEEFLVLLPGTAEAEAMAVAERLRAAIAHSPSLLAAAGSQVTASFGVATWTAADGHFEDLAGLLQRADEALYAAKHAGRDCVIAASGHGIPVFALRSTTGALVGVQ